MTLTQINKAGLDEIALDHVFTIGASGSSAYTFQGEGLNGTVNNPTLYLTRGKTYRFENGSGGHPIRIQSTSGASGTAYNTGVTNNAGSGTVIVEVQHDAPDVLYYQCTSHAAMNGILYITGALLTDGGVTTAKIADDAVTTAKIADGAVTSAKIANGGVQAANINSNAVSTGTLQASAVTTAKIADEAVTLAKLPHGTSSNDGKFLRANNGADPTFETVTGTTINNNADNRLITGSGTANTLNGEANLTYDGVTLSNNLAAENGSIARFGLSGQTNNPVLLIKADESDQKITFRAGATTGVYPKIAFDMGTVGETIHILNNGKVGIGRIPTFRLDVENANNNTFRLGHSGETSHGSHEVKIVGGRNYYHTLRFEGSSYRFLGYDGSSINEKFRVRSTGGVTFNGDTADANALNDYEVGSFTATSNATFSTFAGHYTKIGRQITIHIRMQISSQSNSATFKIDNLPFNANMNSGLSNGSQPGGFGYISGSAFSNGTPHIHMRYNDNYVEFYDFGTALSVDVFAGREIRLGFIYYAD